MTTMINKKHSTETITYIKIDNESVAKEYINANGDIIKKKIINVKDIHCNLVKYHTVDDFFDDMILNHNYSELHNHVEKW